MAARGPQNGRRGLKRGLPLDLGHSRQLSLNKFFDPSAPSMRKVDDEKKEKRKKKELRFKWPLRHCQQSTAQTATPERRPLERRTLVPIKKQPRL